MLTERDLDALPAPVARYVRQSGAVGKPPVGSFRALIHGRIRAGADKPWMEFTGEQVNTYGPRPERFFKMDATMAHLPVDVLHVFAGDSATMRVKLCSLLPMVNASGPELTRAETVTLLNDLCVLAPAALANARITWTAVDDHRARATFTRAEQRSPPTCCSTSRTSWSTSPRTTGMRHHPMARRSSSDAGPPRYTTTGPSTAARSAPADWGAGTRPNRRASSRTWSLRSTTSPTNVARHRKTPATSGVASLGSAARSAPDLRPCHGAGGLEIPPARAGVRVVVIAARRSAFASPVPLPRAVEPSTDARSSA